MDFQISVSKSSEYIMKNGLMDYVTSSYSAMHDGDFNEYDCQLYDYLVEKAIDAGDYMIWSSRLDMLSQEVRFKYLKNLIDRNTYERFHILRCPEFTPTLEEKILLSSIPEHHKPLFNGTWLQKYVGIAPFPVIETDEYDIPVEITVPITTGRKVTTNDELWCQVYHEMDMNIQHHENVLRHSYMGDYTIPRVLYKPFIVAVMNNNNIEKLVYSWDIAHMHLRHTWRNDEKGITVFSKDQQALLEAASKKGYLLYNHLLIGGSTGELLKFLTSYVEENGLSMDPRNDNFTTLISVLIK